MSIREWDEVGGRGGGGRGMAWVNIINWLNNIERILFFFRLAVCGKQKRVQVMHWFTSD